MIRSIATRLVLLGVFVLPAGCLFEGTPPMRYDAGPPPLPDGGLPDAGETDSGRVISGFCAEVACGAGTCNEAARRCDCNGGSVYDPTMRTCVEDRCEGVTCGGGEVCDRLSGACLDLCTPDRTVGELTFCAAPDSDTYVVVVRYDGADTLDLASSQILLNGGDVDLSSSFDAGSATFVLTASSLVPSKYTYLFRMRTNAGADLVPLFIPMWVGDGTRYRDFGWRDAILYQIFTDRFLNGNTANDIVNSGGDLSRVDDPRSHWQGGDFAGITNKIREGYFDDMGVNTLWISSPILQSHNSQPSVDPGDPRRFASYHGYHPVATGYTHLDDVGYANPIEPAFGTPEELHELMNEAHEHGIRVIPDFAANHTHREANVYARHPEWFFEYNMCHNNWDAHRIDCWFTSDMPDVNYGGNPAAVTAVVAHALWLVQEFNFDGYRLDALKHMDDAFVRALKQAVINEIETTVNDHASPNEATVFYMVGESLGGGWPRYHTRADMVQGQVDEPYYNVVRDTLLTFSRSVRDLENFAIGNDTAYLTEQSTNGGAGGYPGAVMGNFFGNHDQVRALTEAGGANDSGYRRLRMAQTFLMTSPVNVPMLYQGDDIGTLGGPDPDNRALHRFTGLSADERASLENLRRAGRLREDHPALRHGSRETVALEDYFWVYRASYMGDEVYVAINRDANWTWSPPSGFSDALGNCSGGTVPSQMSCIFVRD